MTTRQTFAVASTIAMLGGVAAIVSGFLAASFAPDLRLYLPLAVFFGCFIVAVLMVLYHPAHRRGDSDGELRYAATILLIWFPLPLSAAANAFAMSVGLYDPILHDGFPGTLKEWWANAVTQIALGLLISGLYCRQLYNEGHVTSTHRLWATSCSFQFLVLCIWIAWLYFAGRIVAHASA